MPVKKTLSLGTFKELATDYFLERREMGVINIFRALQVWFCARRQLYLFFKGITLLPIFYLRYSI